MSENAIVAAPIWHKLSIAVDTSHFVECQRFNMSSIVPHPAGTRAAEENLGAVWRHGDMVWRPDRMPAHRGFLRAKSLVL